MEPSALSRILAGKQQISLKSTRRVVELLQMTAEEKEMFLSSVVEEVRMKVSRFLCLPERVIPDESNSFPRCVRCDRYR